MIVLSHFCRKAPASLANHHYYARQHGYRHISVDASAMPDGLQQRLLYKYEVLLNTLRNSESGELILLLSEDAAIVEPTALCGLMADRDWLLVRTSSHSLPQADVQIWRNTTPVWEGRLQIIRKCRLGGKPVMSEAELFADLQTEHFTATMNGVCPVMQAGHNFDPLWSRVPTFAISIDDMPQCPENKGVSARYRDVLVEHVNQCRAAGLPMFSFPEHGIAETAERSIYNPGHAIALMTLYTPNIGSYARIAERNFRRYCEARGYTLYVHRDVPPEVGLNATGNWLKPWLLHGYLKHHDWVFWLDADVLIADQQRRLEPMLEGKDYLLAHDVGQWLFNSGVMGFRNTAQNDAMLRDLMSDIANLPDKSSVYASDGDQLYFIRALTRAGLLSEDAVMDLVALNTPWMFRRPDSFIVHYFGMWREMRTMMMTCDDLRIQ